MNPKLLPHVESFIQEMALLSDGVVEVWLFGSRANNRARADSDTDLLVFGPKGFIDLIRSNMKQPTAIDVMVVCDGDNYQDPWVDKSGSLANLRWKRKDELNALYVGEKWEPDEGQSLDSETELGEYVQRSEKAWRVWPISRPTCR